MTDAREKAVEAVARALYERQRTEYEANREPNMQPQTATWEELDHEYSGPYYGPSAPAYWRDEARAVLAALDSLGYRAGEDTPICGGCAHLPIEHDEDGCSLCDCTAFVPIPAPPT